MQSAYMLETMSISGDRRREKNTLFSDIPEETLNALKSRWRTSRFDAGALMLHHNESSTDLFFVLEGRVRVIVYSANGKSVVFRDIHEGSLFGELAALDGGPRSANVIALTETRLAAVSAAEFRSLLSEHPAMLDFLFEHLTGLIRKYSQRIVELCTLSVEDRIRVEIQRLAYEHVAAKNEARISPAPTLDEIASRIGTTREAVSREIARLSRDSVVAREHGDLVIRNLGRLNGMVEAVVI